MCIVDLILTAGGTAVICHRLQLWLLLRNLVRVLKCFETKDNKRQKTKLYSVAVGRQAPCDVMAGHFVGAREVVTGAFGHL